ncbi:metallophosphoesterase [Actinoplanes sp. NPDC023801]|uniref:metallophosphoesterase n=1 Tax=Actinoplanes sp. NPDC023801 TaxID=3154595 RepID=UPI0033BFCD59
MIVIAVLAAVLVLAVFGALHWYLWRRLVGATTAHGSRWRRAGTVLFTAAPVLAVVAMTGESLPVPLVVKSVLAWPGYLWMAVFLYLLLGVLAGEVARPLLTRWLRHRDAEPVLVPALAGAEGVTRTPEVQVETVEPAAGPPALSRRMFVSRVVGGAAAAAALGTVGYGTWDTINGPAVKRVTVPLARLPRGAHGFRIAVVSDVHLSAVLGRGFAQRVTDTVNATQPDLIAVVGDLVDGDVDELAASVEPLRGLRSRHGTFFVTGNHEYFSGADEWVAKVRELGWQPLENARVAMPAFDLAGVNDIAGEDSGDGPDFVKALGDRDPSRASVLLAHQPVVIHDAVRYGVDLQLSGHTHGGQMWPATLIADAANPTLAGLEKYGDTQLYVSRGAGAWGPPVRVGAPSDITVVQLASRQA